MFSRLTCAIQPTLPALKLALPTSSTLPDHLSHQTTVTAPNLTGLMHPQDNLDAGAMQLPSSQHVSATGVSEIITRDYS